MVKLDLHIHTSYSDGVFSPRELLELLQQYSYDLISITDHDTIEGCIQGMKLAAHYDVRILPGVEVSSLCWGRDVHILGYGFDIKNKGFKSFLHSIEKGRLQRAKKIVKLLAKEGKSLDFRDVINLTGKLNMVGRPHIARALIDAGHCRDTKDVFDNYIGEGQSCYVAKPAPSSEKVIEAIKKAGGVSVLAHPYIYRDDDMVQYLIDIGIQGLEVFYSRHTNEETARYKKLADDNGLLKTGGSDFHGHGSDLNFFGFFSAPPSVAEDLSEYIEKCGI
ncbi:MAG: PHP domain-containing protein [Candidatus Cloacimonetes bacterium]|nr:PHP domain-containing protein [Candidatus Cloacimonadota bacterium]